MEPQQQSPHIDNTEITLKDIILQSKDWGKYLLSKWKPILLFGIMGAGLGVLYAYFQKPKYVAELSFVLEESKSSSLSGYAGIASQFGIDLGGATSPGLFSGDNFLEFMKSRLMIENTLLSPIEIEGKQVSMADYYADITKMRESWEANPKLKGLHFPATQNRNTFTRQQDSILNSMQAVIEKVHLKLSRPDKKLSFINVEFSTKDEVFSKIFPERLIQKATDFYIQTKTKRTKANVELLQQKADSLEKLLSQRTYSVAETQDLNLNPAKRIATVRAELLSLDKGVIQLMYGEVMKNLEMSKMAMAQETPLIQIVDRPVYPLRKEKFGRLKGLIVGGFLGGFLTIMILSMKRFYRQIMN